MRIFKVYIEFTMIYESVKNCNIIRAAQRNAESEKERLPLM